MDEATGMSVVTILARLALAAALGGIIGYERRMQHKAIGISGMMLVALGSTAYMLLAKHEAPRDTAAVSRTIQGLLQGIGFLGGAVIFKGGTDVKGIKTASAIWITGMIGLSIATGFWWLGAIVGVSTVAILFVTDLFPEKGRQAESKSDTGTKASGQTQTE